MNSLPEKVRQSAEVLIDAALKEDLQERGDVTCQATIPETMTGSVDITARRAGVLAGAEVAELVFRQLDESVSWNEAHHDGDALEPGSA